LIEMGDMWRLTWDPLTWVLNMGYAFCRYLDSQEDGWNYDRTEQSKKKKELVQAQAEKLQLDLSHLQEPIEVFQLTCPSQEVQKMKCANSKLLWKTNVEQTHGSPYGFQKVQASRMGACISNLIFSWLKCWYWLNLTLLQLSSLGILEIYSIGLSKTTVQSWISPKASILNV
jgi:hypothetical protein